MELSSAPSGAIHRKAPRTNLDWPWSRHPDACLVCWILWP